MKLQVTPEVQVKVHWSCVLLLHFAVSWLSPPTPPPPPPQCFIWQFYCSHGVAVLSWWKLTEGWVPFRPLLSQSHWFHLTVWGRAVNGRPGHVLGQIPCGGHCFTPLVLMRSVEVWRKRVNDQRNHLNMSSCRKLPRGVQGQAAEMLLSKWITKTCGNG